MMEKEIFTHLLELTQLRLTHFSIHKLKQFVHIPLLNSVHMFQLIQSDQIIEKFTIW